MSDSSSLRLGPRDSECSDFDPLTGTLTRPAFIHRMSAAAQVSNACVKPFCLYMIDVDQLRNVNDAYGQQRGDEVLTDIAYRLRRVVAQLAQHPNENLFGRYDGNCFMLLTHKSDLSGESALAERLRDAVRVNPVADGIQITVSIGVTRYRIGEPIDQTLARVEQALYLAKQFGRDRVEVAVTPNVRPAKGQPLPWERSA